MRLTDKKVVFLANPSEPKTKHVYYTGKIEKIENPEKSPKFRIRYRAPWGMTSGWFGKSEVFISLMDSGIEIED